MGNVHCVRSLNEGERSCSICLSNLFIPQATRCGHIFCYTCILRYLFFDDGESTYVAPSQKCPLCNHYISLRDLKPFMFLPEIAAPEEGKEIIMRLMTIEKGSMFAKIATQNSRRGKMLNMGKEKQKGDLSITNIVPGTDDADSIYSRISVVDPEWVRNKINTDRKELIDYRTRCLGASESIDTWENLDNSLSYMKGEAPADVEYLTSIERV